MAPSLRLLTIDLVPPKAWVWRLSVDHVNVVVHIGASAHDSELLEQRVRVKIVLVKHLVDVRHILHK